MIREQTPVEPFALTVKKSEDFSGISRAELYRRMAAGQIEAVKSGRTTLILVASLKAHLAELPKATYRPSPACKTKQHAA
jgi:hypothetical protein